MTDEAWLKKPLFSKLEDAITYQGHGEICGCWEQSHEGKWVIDVRLLESEVRQLMGLMNDSLKAVRS